MPSGAVMLSTHQGRKLIIRCEKCGLRAQYDKQAMLDAGGDRGLPDLRMEIARRLGCERALRPSNDIYDQCGVKILPPDAEKTPRRHKGNRGSQGG